MTQYTTAFKARVLQRLVGPRAISAYRLAGEVGVSQVTLSRWLAAARSVPAMTTPAKKWTGAQKLRVLFAAHGLSETELGAMLRREGCTPRNWTSGVRPRRRRWRMRVGAGRRRVAGPRRNASSSSSASCCAISARWPKPPHCSS